MAQLAHHVPDEGPVPSSAPVRLHLLGQFELRAEGRVITVARAQQRLLAYLAVMRRPVSRALLSQHLSDEPDLDRGPSALRSALWRLPRPGGTPLVESSGAHVALAAEVAVDLWDSERSAKHLHRKGAELAEGASADPSDWAEDLLPGWVDEWLLVEQDEVDGSPFDAVRGSLAAVEAAVVGGVA